MAQDFGAAQYTSKPYLRGRTTRTRTSQHDQRTYAQHNAQYANYMGSSVEDEAGIDSDDPTNTAMFLDDSEESELKSMVPGTPLAYKQLEKVTVKSISRQRDSQTPGRPQNGTSAIAQSRSSRSSRYTNDESPSKRGKGQLAAQTVIPMLTPAVRRPNVDVEPQSVLQIRSSRRASNILDRIKQAPQAQYNILDKLKQASAEHTNAHEAGHGARSVQTGVDPSFNKNEFSPFLFSKLARVQNRVSSRAAEPQPRQDVCKTPETKPRRYGPSTPYNMLRALSEKSSESGSVPRVSGEAGSSKALGAGDSKTLGSDPFMSTPIKHDGVMTSETATRTENRERIESLRRFFDKHMGDLIPSETEDEVKAVVPDRDRGDLLISFDAGEQAGQVPCMSRISQMSSIQQSDRADELLQSPSPRRAPCTLEPRAINAADSASSLLLSFTSRHDHDLSKPIPFLLNQIEQQDAEWTGDKSNLIDLSSRLNTSINALNCGLREHLARATAPDVVGAVNGVAAGDDVVAKAEPASANPVATNSCVEAGDQASASEIELKGHVDTLRKTMEETKSIVSSIQAELGQQRQGHASDDAKLDGIARLLGALDMRLHMLEDRQRLDQTTAQASPMARRTNTGSTKIHPNNSQIDILSRLGQFIVYCLSRYPLMIIGALFIVLVSELVYISGIRLDAQMLNEYGRYALGEVKRHLPQPPS
ncbi:hypothetical protein LPJ58_004223 [Coemansia sp. RSA 1591]|nr:hypothetical protein LPJ58_004223 [Coemansia sp. RSA 1591]KAJ1758147.1 hypothetical protein LPJ69_004173 [Coemansia sp. RSA 1752]KAJ2272598.1 hypothetical protein EV176_003606 [Coemansia sp. RSA 451]KAJ2446170.1 hypothetical protein IWW46_001081 [Coemansia sp. RSA 2440]